MRRIVLGLAAAACQGAFVAGISLLIVYLATGATTGRSESAAIAVVAVVAVAAMRERQRRGRRRRWLAAQRERRERAQSRLLARRRLYGERDGAL